MQDFSVSPLEMLSSLWRYRQLIISLVRREVVGRYRGSVLGLLWSFFNPVFMLAVYTFVFSVVFRSRWPGGGSSRAEFALILFAGLLVFNLCTECINRAPSLILGNANYVKKVVFPLEILPWVNFGAALFHTMVSLMVWFLFSFGVFGVPPLTVLLFPLLLLALMLFTMGCSWILASLGVYLRDVSQVIGIVTSTMLFLTPIFYPVTAIPEPYRRVLYLNPLTFVVEQTQNLLIFGKHLEWIPFVVFLVFSAFFAWSGFVCFQKTRKGFADVL